MAAKVNQAATAGAWAAAPCPLSWNHNMTPPPATAPVAVNRRKLMGEDGPVQLASARKAPANAASSR
jgi:hypothetical protein